jgi:hypothetical protein
MSADVGFNDYPRVVSLSSTIGAGAAYPRPTWSKPHRQVRCIVRNSQQIAPKLGPSRQLLQNLDYAQNPLAAAPTALWGRRNGASLC